MQVSPSPQYSPAHSQVRSEVAVAAPPNEFNEGINNNYEGHRSPQRVEKGRKQIRKDGNKRGKLNELRVRTHLGVTFKLPLCGGCFFLFLLFLKTERPFVRRM